MKNAGFGEQRTSLIHSIPFKVVKDTRLAMFQFKIAHHMLPTNATLFRGALICLSQVNRAISAPRKKL